MSDASCQACRPDAVGLVPRPDHTCALGIAVALSWRITSHKYDLLSQSRGGWRSWLAGKLRRAATRLDRPAVRRSA